MGGYVVNPEELTQTIKILDENCVEGFTLSERVRALAEECNDRGAEINDIVDELYGHARKGKPSPVIGVRMMFAELHDAHQLIKSLTKQNEKLKVEFENMRSKCDGD